MRIIYYTLLIIPLIFCKSFTQIETKGISDSLHSPVKITAEQDHARLMKLLGIDSLRPGPSWKPTDPNAANTDESKANPYTNYPDPLIMNDGRKVTTSEMWWKLRRPEMFQRLAGKF